MGGGGKSKTTIKIPPPTAQEMELIALNAELAKKQLAQIDTLAPYQQQLLEASLAEMQSQSAYSAAYSKLVTPEQQAQASADQFAQAQKLGPLQQQLLEMQLEDLKRGGAATDEQKALIADATQQSIDAGASDIDMQTQRGIGLISDELANSRGLRLSDSPITGEAALLARAGLDQKASLTKNLRAAQATSVLNYPLAVQQMQSGINMGQQNLTQAAQQFQAQLQQQAALNRQSLFGNTQQTGLGLASVGTGAAASALGSLTSSRNAQSSSSGSSSSLGGTLGNIGKLAGGIGGLIGAFSDRRLKSNIQRIGTHPLGIGLYAYDIFGERTIGVMADEVERVLPEAVSVHPSGFKMVDYSMVFHDATL